MFEINVVLCVLMFVLGSVAISKQNICRHFDGLAESLQQRKAALLQEVDAAAAEKKAILLVSSIPYQFV